MGALRFHAPGWRGPFTDPASLGSWTTDWTRLRFLRDEGIWFISTADNGYEIAVAGDERRPDPVRLAVAQAVVPRVRDLAAQVVAHLDAALDYKQLRSSGEWYLEGVHFGLERNHPEEVFDVVLTTDEHGGWDDCELWYVTCALVNHGDAAAFEVQGKRGGWHGKALARRDSGNPATAEADEEKI